MEFAKIFESRLYLPMEFIVEGKMVKADNRLQRVGERAIDISATASKIVDVAEEIVALSKDGSWEENYKNLSQLIAKLHVLVGSASHALVDIENVLAFE